jgi:predicted metallopeptidase
MVAMELFRALDLDEKIKMAVELLELAHIKADQVVAFRSTGSKARARARIYSMPRIWQQALDVAPHYCIEFLSQHFDHLKEDDQWRVIIHELMHIPKTFSGALVPHIGRGHRHQVTHKTVEALFKRLKAEK